jgi:hypothetical protein
MASTTAAIFKPSTDNFGHLTLHATILGDGVISPEDHKARINGLSLLAFVLVLITAMLALYTVDKTVFAHHDQPVAPTYAGMAVDTN